LDSLTNKLGQYPILAFEYHRTEKMKNLIKGQPVSTHICGPKSVAMIGPESLPFRAGKNLKKSWNLADATRLLRQTIRLNLTNFRPDAHDKG
jgi:hypothetical protein